MEFKSNVSKKSKSTSNTERLLKAIGTIAVIAMIWRFPASLAEKHLKNIHI